jgi:hypothetical protein
MRTCRARRSRSLAGRRTRRRAIGRGGTCRRSTDERHQGVSARRSSERSMCPADARDGENSFGDNGYGGPCPPEGDQPTARCHSRSDGPPELDAGASPAGARRYRRARDRPRRAHRPLWTLTCCRRPGPRGSSATHSRFPASMRQRAVPASLAVHGGRMQLTACASASAVVGAAPGPAPAAGIATSRYRNT